MATITPSIALKQATAAAWLAQLDTAAGQVTISLYTGTKPAGPDTAITSQVLLGIGTCSTTTAVVQTVGSAVSLVFNAITPEDQALATGTATWARIKDDAGTPKFDVDASTTGGGGFLQLNSTTITEFGPINFASFVINF